MFRKNVAHLAIAREHIRVTTPSNGYASDILIEHGGKDVVYLILNTVFFRNLSKCCYYRNTLKFSMATDYHGE